MGDWNAVLMEYWGIPPTGRPRGMGASALDSRLSNWLCSFKDTSRSVPGLPKLGSFRTFAAPAAGPSRGIGTPPMSQPAGQELGLFAQLPCPHPTRSGRKLALSCRGLLPA
jgi:hypothetical protein